MKKDKLIVPVKEDEEYDVEIIGVGKAGDGIAKIEGYTVFVPQTGNGDKVRIKIKKVLPNFAFSEVVDKEIQDTENF